MTTTWIVTVPPPLIVSVVEKLLTFLTELPLQVTPVAATQVQVILVIVRVKALVSLAVTLLVPTLATLISSSTGDVEAFPAVTSKLVSCRSTLAGGTGVLVLVGAGGLVGSEVSVGSGVLVGVSVGVAVAVAVGRVKVVGVNSGVAEGARGATVTKTVTA